MGLTPHPAPGASAKLTTAQRERFGALLDQGAVAHGFEGERWTRKRVVRLIEDTFGVTYEVSSVGRLLRDMGFTVGRCRSEKTIARRTMKWRNGIRPACRR